MTSSVRIPRTIKATTGRLTDLDSLATAAGWERAAIVHAWTYEGVNRFDSAREPARYTIRQFAKLGINGLRTPEGVSAYRNAWKQAMAEADAPDVRPGQQVKLPDLPFPPVVSESDPRYLGIADHDAIAAQAEADGTGPAKALDIAKNTRAMAAAIKASPAVAKAAKEALGPQGIAEAAEDPAVAEAVAANSKAHLAVQRAVDRQAIESLRRHPVLKAPGSEPWAVQFNSELGLAADHMHQLQKLLTAFGKDRQLPAQELKNLLHTLDMVEAYSAWCRAFANGEEIADEAAKFLQNLEEGR